MAVHTLLWQNDFGPRTGSLFRRRAPGWEEERRLLCWAGRLDEALDLVCGLADEPTRERLDDELNAPDSDASLLLEGVRLRVGNALNIDWEALDEGDGFAELLEAVRNHRRRNQDGPGCDRGGNG